MSVGFGFDEQLVNIACGAGELLALVGGTLGWVLRPTAA